MKALKTFSISCLAFFTAFYAHSQIVADKTNKIKLNFSNTEVKTILPEMSAEFLARMAEGKSISSVNLNVNDDGTIKYEIS